HGPARQGPGRPRRGRPARRTGPARSAPTGHPTGQWHTGDAAGPSHRPLSRDDRKLRDLGGKDFPARRQTGITWESRWGPPLRAAPRADPSVRDYRTGLLPWVSGGEALLREGMHRAGGGEPPFLDPVHPRPGQIPALLATAPQRVEPVPGHLVTESRYPLAAAGHGAVRPVSAQHAGQPAALHRDGLMPASPGLGFHLGKPGPHPFRDRDPPHPEPPAPRPRADMREAGKPDVSGFPSPLAARCPAECRPNSISRVLPGG